MTPKRRTLDRDGGRAPARALTLLAAVLALILQVFVVQTHTHAQPPLGSWNAVGASSLHTEGDGHNHTHVELAHEKAGCIICAVQTTSSSATLADPTILSVADNSAHDKAALAIRSAPITITHSWQSRAPPLAL